ncbi:hypothetical protein A2U01_0067387, partial [Trifolium medium]|nr:hypothetical protein [Trifolium medium]
DETAHPEPEDMEVEIQGDDVLRDMEEEEIERESDGGPSKVRRPAWVNPYEGQPEPKEFPGGRPIRRYCMIMEHRTLRDVCTTTL